ncbi:metal-dependent transcriptional regulator [Lachnoclostridium sp. Marseille-P6806]|uniref:metal-dependent transcriptional regulator n=1 Tax=Lachnoclostridium sp. Marseille-P6806 TaxID=2364793 RepID=UPI00102FFBE0|nr:metal-dependent transcriptional regulator [Lachnoclostridium sp. Marseille-P6806]
MNIHESAEDYLETILILNERLGQVRSIDIAVELGYSKPSVSVAMKKLRENGYIDVDGGGYITLNPSGMEIAGHTYAKHKLLRKILIALGVDEKTATDEACRIEHNISDDTYNKINRYYENNMK